MLDWTLRGRSQMVIDLNSDVGESFGNWTFGDDARIIESVSSVNVACGFHAGDPSGIRATCAAAATAGVTVGAHPGYRDLTGFGRRFLDVEPAGLTDDVVYQIGALQALAAAAGTQVRYVKPHGALYNTIAVHERQARAVVQAIRDVDGSLPLLVLPGTVIEAEARSAGLRTVIEVFADRAYMPDGALVPRREPGAVLHDEADVVAHVLRMATEGEVVAIDGSRIRVDAESVCLHGDTPGAVAMAAAVRRALESADVPVSAFA
jgi:UPF0271 protein